MNMVLALSTIEQSPEALKAAVDFALKQQAELFVVFILDTNISSAIFDKLTDIGFIGEKPGAQLESAVLGEYRRQAEDVLSGVQRLCREKGVDCRVRVTQGEFADKCLEAAAECAADTLIIIRTRQSFLSRLLAGGGIDALIKSAPCEIKVFEA